MLIVQLLSPTTVAKHFNGLGDGYKGLLGSLQRANLFDLAGVPWLLSHLIRHANRSGLSRSGVIERIITGNFAAANVPGGVRRMSAICSAVWPGRCRRGRRCASTAGASTKSWIRRAAVVRCSLSS